MGFCLILKHCVRVYPLAAWPGGLSTAPNPGGFPSTALRGRRQVNIISVGDAAFLIYWKAVLHGSMFAGRPVDYLTPISLPISSP